MSAAAGGARAAQERERDPGQASIGELLTAITRDTSTLVRQEIQLAKAEARAEVRSAVKVAGMFGGAALGGFMVLLFLSYAMWWGLSNVIDQGWSALIVAAVWAVIAAVLITMARQRMRGLKALPQTSGSVRRIPDAVKAGGDHRTGGHQ
ncbi:phage holin family protein [Micromonospora sp. NBC_01796]|uniref:phage holin family protein n=1 Tax=Micromonospora sp. NBC_01796 TaxID=2975987 RepID=UPI002DD801DF|nr:phage holin family protein [Micromonospora sp. NBC_01796]WSA83249.1 phage holin family protein [Micromonospora sp. NBC_01796]